ncbi:MAG: SUMF1/EgtB/PvdO family nonheme iron enzyme [Candidatus Latescibacterota bacterium]|nr:SUMF1/EgtB/PvdO family nonheme iron enzyme [Candidatus Latescibacterota bacterium]
MIDPNPLGSAPCPSETVEIPVGNFLMGSKKGQRNESPLHRVWVDAFRLAVRPVTRAEYQCFLFETQHPPPRHWQDERFEHPQQPAVGISWFDASTYCRWLAERTGSPWRLPTEAEREKASRGGRQGLAYPWGDQLPDWLDPHYQGDEVERPDLVGQDPPNGYGLHNMADLVHEWCSDWYDPEYYALSPHHNPAGPESGVRRASRGGSWRHAIKVTRCAARSSILPDRQLADYGFRVAV